jgi:hypothetical protein
MTRKSRDNSDRTNSRCVAAVCSDKAHFSMAIKKIWQRVRKLDPVLDSCFDLLRLVLSSIRGMVNQRCKSWKAKGILESANRKLQERSTGNRSYQSIAPLLNLIQQSQRLLLGVRPGRRSISSRVSENSIV